MAVSLAHTHTVQTSIRSAAGKCAPSFAFLLWVFFLISDPLGIPGGEGRNIQVSVIFMGSIYTDLLQPSVM